MAALALPCAGGYTEAVRGSSSVVEHLLAKEGVASSSLVSRSRFHRDRLASHR
jgi:hypothetical protein